MIHLMNSAVMPSGAYGSYGFSPATIKDLCAVVNGKRGPWQSHVGYEQTAAMISRWTGANVPVSRDETVLKPGDTMFIVRLRYRIQNPATKGQPVSENPADWELAWVTFKEGD